MRLTAERGRVDCQDCVTAPLSVVVLTFNEERNIRQCLRSVADWAGEVFLLDSYSTDATVGLAEEMGARVVQHEFEGYAAQRNWALKNLPFSYPWALFLDADESVSSELKSEILALGLDPASEVEGYFINRRFYFMGSWIKRGGYYPTWLLRLFKWRIAWCEEREVDEHFFVPGRTGFLRCDLIHENHKGIAEWVEKHNRYAALQAVESTKAKGSSSVAGRGGPSAGSQMRCKRWLGANVWDRLPLLIRPFLYFAYRYWIRLGFLDGRAGLAFHTLHGLWYRLLVDIHIIERRRRAPSGRVTQRPD